MNVEQTCERCGWHAAGADNPACPRCGAGLAIDGFASDAVPSVSDAVHITMSRVDGVVTAERTHETRADGEVRTAIDAGGPQRIFRRERDRPTTLEEEERFAEQFVRARNARNRTKHRLEPKPVEDGAFTDRVVRDERGTIVLRLQIRKLDDYVARALGRDRSFNGERSPADLETAITNAIAKKALADAGEKARHDLLLVVQHPVGQILAGQLAAKRFDLGGYHAVWIHGYDEDPFMLTAPLAPPAWLAHRRAFGEDAPFVGARRGSRGVTSE